MGDQAITKSKEGSFSRESFHTTKPQLPIRNPMRPILQLRQSMGNQGFGRFIQAKLKIGQTGDKYEKEADRVADRVMRMPAHVIRRQEEEKEEEENLRTKSQSGAAPAVLPNIAAGIQSLSGGQPLSRSSRSYFEPSRNTIQRKSSFESAGYGVRSTSGREKITRPEQVLQEYGMTCYGTSVMYMIQSYGLVPPNMTREEFEYAFTPLNPYDKKNPLNKPHDIKVGGVTQTGARFVDLITKALQGTSRPRRRRTSIGRVTRTEATLRGATRGSYRVSTIMRHMPKILAAFKKQSLQPKYSFMKKYKPESGKAYTPKAREKWSDCSKQLEAGTIGEDYFKEGNTILVGINYKYPPRRGILHWVVIVKDWVLGISLGRRFYYLYPADDPLGYRTYVMAPFLNKRARKIMARYYGNTFKPSAGLLKYNNIEVDMYIKGNAYRRK